MFFLTGFIVHCRRCPMHRRFSLLPFALCAFLLAASTARAQVEPVPTQVLVRAVAHDAKLIGSKTEGAYITIRDVATGAVLAEGRHEGGTGDTERIMTTPRERGATVYDTEGAAGFLATLPLARPTVVEITAYGPLGTPDAVREASKRMLLVPGQHVVGEGVVLELHGFTVRLLAPETATAARAGAPIPVTAHVTLLCGCPTEPGGTWDSDRFTITARLLQDDRVVVDEAPLVFGGEQSTFTGELTPPAPGAYVLEVLAMDPERANFGQAVLPVVAVE